MGEHRAESESVLADEIRAQSAVLKRFRAVSGAQVQRLGRELADLRPVGVLIAARGSSDHAAVYAKYLFGARLGLPVVLATPSLFTLYERPPRVTGWLAIAISQSGASPDVISVLAEAARQGCSTVAITDCPESGLGRVAQHVVPLQLEGERSVAATGSFTTTLFALAHLIAGFAGDAEDDVLARVPEAVDQVLEQSPQVREQAELLGASDVCAVIGRGYGFPVALEWSLKLKEVAGVFAEPFSSADYRHGPIALAGSGLPVFVIDARGPTRSDLAELRAEVKRRGARLCRVSDAPEAELRFPEGPEYLAPIPATVIGQLLAWHAARLRGLDPDAPEGLKKITRTL
ncbi:MAG: SIS domain-containing protein [bacterium]|nr:SIS domain-containing protein [bacterium]